MSSARHILITGATSGIGLGLARACHAGGWRVTAINRRQDAAVEAELAGAAFQHFDVRDEAAVRGFCSSAATAGNLPDVWFLGAGINKVDNVGDLSLPVFREVLETNMMGVFNFVAHALPAVRARGAPATFVSASSTTNIFPNPNCLGYYLSKWAVFELFRQLDKVHRKQGIRFRSLVLGPVATGIFVSGKLASKLQARVRDALMVTVDQAVPHILRFLDGDAQASCYPMVSCLFFRCMRLATAIWPGLYKGSAPPSASPG